MMQWKRAIATKICLFGVLVAVLAGCNDSKSGQANKDPGAFHVETGGGGGTGGTGGGTGTGGTGTGTGGDGTGNQKVSVETKIVAGSGDNASPPGGGTATPSGDGLNLLDVLKTTRFTETAPDTVGGATYQSSPIIEYDMGNLVAQSGDDNGIFITPVKGQLRFPQTALSTAESQPLFPIIVFLHGQASRSIPSYQGYDYIAEDLAAHGYVVVSIDANAINGSKLGDYSSQSRAQLLLGTLDRLHDIDLKGQMDADKVTGPLDVLKGRLDFTRIGIMGHSRGGQGISNAIKFNQTRRGVSEKDLKAVLLLNTSYFKAFPELTAAVIQDATAPKLPPTIDDVKFQAAIAKYNIFFPLDREKVAPYDFKGAFMLAPTDLDGNQGIDNVPLAILLPSCDGDVRGFQGAVAYDHNRFGPSYDIAPRYQILVKGANHDYYNTTWNTDAADITGDGTDDPNCKASLIRGIRLNADDQRRGGNFILSSFMRYHVGGEQKFASYWNGMAQLPEAACPMDKVPCDERVVLTIQHAQDQRQLIQRFDQTNSLEYNALGKHTELSGFDAMASCDMPVGASIFASTCSPKRLDDFVFLEQNWDTGKYDVDKKNGLRSIADHLELAWSTPHPTLTPDPTSTTESKPKPTLTTDLTGLFAKGMDYLTFRLAVVAPMGQEVWVTLTDSVGKTATITASDYSDALYSLPRGTVRGMPMIDDPRDVPFVPGQVKSLLNMVAIPLKAFQGVDPTRLKELKLTFPKESGKVAITDIELQNFGRERAERIFFARK